MLFSIDGAGKIKQHTCSTSRTSSVPTENRRIQPYLYRQRRILPLLGASGRPCHLRLRQMSVVKQRPATYSRTSCESTCHRQRNSAKSAHAPPQASWASWTALGSVLLAAGPAIAGDGLKYDPGAGADIVKQVAGAAYVVLLAVFAVRLLTKRAKFATEERLASAAKGEDERPPDPSKKRVTPPQSLWAAVQAGVFAYLLYLFSSSVDGYFERQPLPDQYTARNITVAISTIVRGLSYLITFIFGANALGLFALTVQLLINPEAVNEAEPQQDLHDASNDGQEGSSGDAL